MATKWTEEQKLVIATINNNLLVSAAAGSGKTAVLVERIIQMITDEENPVDIDKFVIMTFTRAAAAQMRQKISEALEKKIEENPDNKNLMKQYKMLHNATICTIDSFCIGIVRDYFHEIDIDPTFRVADETELGLISADTIHELFESKYEEGSEQFLRLAEAYGNSKDDKNLVDLVLKLASKALSQPWPLKWLEGLKENYRIKDVEEFNDTAVAKNITTYVKEMLGSKTQDLVLAEKMCEMAGGPDFYEDMVSSFRRIISSVLEQNNYSEIGSVISGIQFGRMSTKKCPDENLRARVKDILESTRTILKKIMGEYYFESAEEIVNKIQLSAPFVDCLVDLTKEYLARFKANKKEKNVIDFSDAEHYALEILLKETESGYVRSAAALELQSQYAEIIIDEYQDSNYIQESIANAIAGNEKERPFIFTVGDVKQSIYKFRNACPEIFIEKQKLYGENEEKGKLINLDRNFRSREEVLEATNCLFNFMMIPEIGGINYDDKCSLKCGISDAHLIEKPYKSELILIHEGAAQGEGEVVNSTENESDSNADDTDGNSEESSVKSDNKRELEARIVAKRIKDLVYKEKLLVRAKINGEEVMRPAQFGDITILLRSMKDWSNAYTNVLESEGIPVVSDSRDGFFKTNEVRLISSYLTLLDNPRQDIPLTAVLHSVMCGLSVEDLAQINILGGGAASFYDTVMASRSSDMLKEDVKAKLDSFFSVFEELHSVKNDISVVELINLIYEKTHYYSYVSAMKDGLRRKANLELFLRYAANYENTSYSGLFSFIRYLDQLKSHELDYGEASCEQDANAVKIMSIHKSKGLEFPVVILGGMSKGFNMMDINSSNVISSEYGMALQYIDLEERVKYPSIYDSFIKLKMKEELLGEELRLLYVAMTRAKEKLIMVGSSDAIEKKTYAGIDWISYGKDKVDYSHLIALSNYMQMTYPAALRNPDLFDIASVFSENEADVMMSEKIDQVGNITQIETTDQSGKISKSETLDQPENISNSETIGKSVKACAESDSCKGKSSTDAGQVQSDSEFQDLVDRIVKCRNSIYPFDSDETVPIKLSVSDLKLQSIMDEQGEDVFKETKEYEPGDKKTVPDFMKTDEEKSSGTNYGTLVHKCMQFMNLSLSEESEVAAFLDELLSNGKINEEERKRLNPAKFVRFLKQDIAKRMAESEKLGGLFREQQFMLGMRACDIRPEYAGNETMIPIQGVIDVMFIEEGGIVILDYKTDRADATDGAEKLKSLYSTQLDYYAEAASKLIGLPVKEKLLYSFALDEIIKCD